MVLSDGDDDKVLSNGDDHKVLSDGDDKVRVMVTMIR